MSLLTLFQLVEKLKETEIELCIGNFTSENYRQFFIEILECVKEGNEEKKNEILLNWGFDEKVIHGLIFEIIEMVNTLEDSPRKQTLKIIERCQFLFRRRLYRACMVCLNEAKELARRFEYFELLVTIAAIEINLKKRGFLSENNQPKNDAVHYNYLAINYRQYVGYQYNLERQRTLIEGPDTKKLDKYRKEALLRTESAARSVTAKLLFYEIRAKLCYLLEEEEEAYLLIKKLLNLYKKHSHFLEVPVHRSKYVSTVGNYFSLSRIMGKEEDAFEEIRAVMILAERNNDKSGYRQMAWQVSSISYMEQLRQFWQERAYQQIIELIPDIEGLFKQDVFLSYKCEAYRFFAYAYYYKETLGEALQWCEAILDAYGQLISGGSKSIVIQLKLIILYELGELVQLKNEIEKTKIFYKNERRLSQFENLFLAFILQLYENKGENEAINCEEFLILFEALEEESQLKNTMGYFDIITWIKNKLKI